MNSVPIRSVVVVGSGNVAEALVRALGQSPFELRQLFARNSGRGTQLAHIGQTEWTSDPACLAPADLYIIAVSDRAVAEVGSSLSWPSGAVVAHTAGCVPLDVLPARIARKAVLYPLQTFTHGRETDFSEVPLFIETSDPALQADMEIFARRLSRTVLPADSALRARIHLAGVFANNFTNHLFACGKQLLQHTGLPDDVLRPLIRETAAKALAADDPADVQTGPAVRGDFTTQQHHLDLLGEDATLKTIYRSISKHIWETSKKT